MPRPVGSKNKPKTFEQFHALIPDSTKLIATATMVAPQIVKPDIHYDCIIAIRSLRDGPFKGLWELVELNKDMSRKFVITDANSKGTVITLASRRISRIVIGQ